MLEKSQSANQNTASIAEAMTNAEKVDLLSGFGMWKTAAVPAYGIKPIVMTDGTYGVRYSIPQIDSDERGGMDLDAFLSVVNQRASDVAIAWGEMKPATCFPNGSAMGNSWDVGLMQRLGELLGKECRAMGVHLLLGPGINLRRTPLAGRSYEYYSEDPLVTGKLSAAVIEGIQSQGVGTSLKHFACNNSEVERTTMDSVVEERALREIYLKGFEIAIKQSKPWTIMSSYNRLNGVQASQDPWLLDQVLRKEWGFEGVVVSDWHGIKDRAVSLMAGGDLDMPESPRRKADLLEALNDGSIPAEVAHLSCQRMLDMIERCNAGAEAPVPVYTADDHHAEARAMAAASMVLVSNNALLPIQPAMKNILVVGRDAGTPVIQGSGCATTIPTMVDQPLEQLQQALGAGHALTFRENADAETLALAAGADLVLVYTSTEGAYDGEGSDRTTLALGPGQDEMIAALAAVSDKVAVVIACPDAVEMPWIEQVNAVLVTFYSGQAMGGAVADVLTGKVNPSGKLSVTFPKRLADVPGFLHYPGENGRHIYGEGIHVGYRSYDLREIEPLFPFGHGLSYTTFAYSDLTLSSSEIGLRDEITVAFTVTNTGDRAGAEIAQLYLQARGKRLKRSPQELKGFAKPVLEVGESKRVEIILKGSDLAIWDPALGRWVLEGVEARIVVGASSRDPKLSADLAIKPSVLPFRRIAYDTQPAYVLPNAIACEHISAYLTKRCSISNDDAMRMLNHCSNSFFGIFTSLERRLRLSIPEAEVDGLISDINAAMDAAEAKL
ncbi:glycoside hydrolase family 3 C-terminal domain-containing protein [Agrobacterium tumefaciens]|uniref:glycoside hydrolase family 3 C-terminal domain-containing protein n=1 Tax=Agrobacterium tumefaciens TaxID=358 RepID=UPI0021CEB15C|nr:glycoside hydrolase family 3 C-terminal domain-containing protein [Agrobacterium tumefaciens]UXS03775.1 glycosyl hydrolase [Agrobacterium tumefaciens]